MDAELTSHRADRAAERTIGDRDFRAFQRLIYQESGIHLADFKKPLLVGRLARRLRVLGLSSYREYLEHVLSDPGGAELVRLLDCISTNETQFFRESAQFEFLPRAVFPAWKAAAQEGRRTRAVRVWSAACSSGEEPYSIAMSRRSTRWGRLRPVRGHLDVVIPPDRAPGGGQPQPRPGRGSDPTTYNPSRSRNRSWIWASSSGVTCPLRPSNQNPALDELGDLVGA